PISGTPVSSSTDGLPAHDKGMAENFLAGHEPNVEEFSFRFRDDVGDAYDNIFRGTLEQAWVRVLKLNVPECGIGVFLILSDPTAPELRLPGTLDLTDPTEPRLVRPIGRPAEAIPCAIEGDDPLSEFSPILDETLKKDPPSEIEARSKNDDKTVAAGDEPIQPHDGCLRGSGSRGGSEGEHKAAHAENGISGVCVHCHLNPPDGSERPIADSEEWIHPRCETAFIDARMAEEGLLGDAPTCDPVDPLMGMLERIE